MFETPCYWRESFPPNQAAYMVYFKTVDEPGEVGFQFEKYDIHSHFPASTSWGLIERIEMS